MSDYDTIYYPQDEMTTFMLPVTIGCSYNACAFCSMYKESHYVELPLSEIKHHLINSEEYTERVFLTGADPLAIGFEKIKKILNMIHTYLPYCACVAAYASVENLRSYSIEELEFLHHAGLRMLYVGFESGNDAALKMMGKQHRLADAIEQGQKLNAAKIQFSAIVMYGIAGAGHSEENAILTADLLNKIEVNRVITMNLSVFNNTKLESMVKAGKFVPADSKERIGEVKTLLEHLKPNKTLVFDTTHPTNIVSIKGKLPEDKARLMTEIEGCLWTDPE